jgi:membrane protein implicated in regulation of membrane protease activity
MNSLLSFYAIFTASTLNILPEGSVKNEFTFFVMLAILLTLIAVAYILRVRSKRHTNNV